jgi:GNAT superfamily N-acetyltransferase
VQIERQRGNKADLSAYASIPISFKVRDVLDLDPMAFTPDSIPVHRIAEPYVKDYDAASNSPLTWRHRFDLNQWAIFVARIESRPVGGAAVVWPAEDFALPSDRALLWDLRVAPDARRRGIGSELMTEVEAWATRTGARFLRVETQHVNVPAYRFYVRAGYELIDVCRSAYEAYPDELQLWLEKGLTAPNA